MKKIKYYLEYQLVVIINFLIRIFPRSLADLGGRSLGVLCSLLFSKRNQLLLDNLRKAFPEKTEKEIRRTGVYVWKNLGQVAVEFSHIEDINRDNYEKFFSYEGLDILEKAKSLNKGLVMVGFHFTNWEYLGISAHFVLGNMLSIYRPPNNPYVNDWILKKRTQGSLKLMSHRQAAKASLKTLREKQSVGILMDQNLYTGGVFVDFFGRPAATTTLPALLHLRMGSPIVLSYLIREGHRFRVFYELPSLLDMKGKEDEELRNITQILTYDIEKIIRRNPQYWFWIHNRWKRSHEGLKERRLAPVGQ